jgi:flagellin
MEGFTFNAGTTSNQMATAITQVADAIGVEATFNRDLVTILSTTYGQDSFVSFSVLSEGDKGQVGRSLSAFRAEGSDVEGTINGVQASSKGNAMWINTSTLALTIDVTPGMTDNFRFNINGGGAQFQLGPDVVTNQQVRMGIQSMNTARLGGVNGKLFELKTGGPADMRSDPNRAANILLDAINVVAELRGRLGAMQGFTMDTNIKTMEDTLENMIQAESQIRDADFAVETANLTRAQVLVQSGTTVLSIANQNPQNVLALLR